MRQQSILAFTLIVFVSCTTRQVQPEQVQQTTVTVNSTSALQFISGLWSLDKNNSLNNDGYYFLNDRTFLRVASERTGNWQHIGKDTLLLKYSATDSVAQQKILIIDTLTSDRMVLRDHEGIKVFRKVPFGKNPEATVLSGFMGSISSGTEKEYTFNLPSSKEIKIELNANDSDIHFRFFEGTTEFTTAAVRSWEGIIVRGGSYQVKISKSKKAVAPDEAVDFNLKVLGY